MINTVAQAKPTSEELRAEVNELRSTAGCLIASLSLTRKSVHSKT
jgi:hypothetical protein